jgi:NAD(P)H dehydrogenase (quinone)
MPMRVLIIFARPGGETFCRAVMTRVTQGLRAAGHEVEILDLNAVGFDPVFKPNDYLQFLDETQLPDISVVKDQVVTASGGAIRRLITRWWIRNMDTTALVAFLAKQRPKDVQWHQETVARAQGLIFIAPIFWMGFPAILKGWIERVFTYGFAYSLTPEGWKGDLSGRIPLLKHNRALVIPPTFFAEEHYRQGWQAALTKVLDEWTFTNTGIENVGHVFLYAVNAADEATREGYLQKARGLGQEF